MSKINLPMPFTSRARALSLLALALSSLAGCPKQWDQPATVPDSVDIPARSYQGYPVQVHSGGSPGPKPVEELSARCVDASVCRADVTEASGTDLLRVFGLAAGSTTLELRYAHPVRGPQDRQVPVTITPARALRRLALGEPVPGAADADAVLLSDTAELGCVADASLEKWSECMPAAAQGEELFHRSAKSYGLVWDQRYLVCVALDEERIVRGISYFVPSPRWQVGEKQDVTRVGTVEGSPCERTATFAEQH